jgi:hypothetical protein
MLNLFNKKSKDTLIEIKKKSSNFFLSESEKILNRRGEIRHYSPAIKEWFNCVYVYNKNYFFKALPITDKIINRLIKSYFNLNPDKFFRFKRLSVNRIFVSKAEMKHTNNKVIITVYTYNRQRFYFLNKIRKLQKMFMFIEQYKFKAIKTTNRIRLLKNKLNLFNFLNFNKKKRKISKYIKFLYKNLSKKNRFLKKINRKLNKKIYNYYRNKSIYNIISNNRIKNMGLRNTFLNQKLDIIFIYIKNLIPILKKNKRLKFNTLKILN